MNQWGEDQFGFGAPQPSRRDLLEIDQDGRTTSEKKQERQKKQRTMGADAKWWGRISTQSISEVQPL